MAIHTAQKHSHQFGPVNVRFVADIFGVEGGANRYLVVNPSLQPTNDEIAKMTLELGCYILGQNEIACKPAEFEYLNLFSGTVVKMTRLRKQTLTRAADTAQMVEALWEIL